MRAWGVDGYSRGWLGVWIDDSDARGLTFFSTAAELASLDTSMLMIDIPIGLPESGNRGCDLGARKLLKGAQSRVFLGIRRPLLAHLTDYEKANAWAKADGSGLSRQAFAILPKVAAIDAIIDPKHQRYFHESHPEVVFWRLNGGTVLPSKHEHDGIRRRRDLMLDLGFVEIDSWLGQLRGTGAKPDDLLDACALAIAAQQATEGSCYRVKCEATRDSRGLRMDIWF